MHKLKSKKLIDRIFKEGRSLSVFPLKMIFIKTGDVNQVGVSVGKKKIKHAVDRNRIKRLMKESYRLNKKMLIDNNVCGYAFMILYIGEDVPDYKLVNIKTKALLTKFLTSLTFLKNNYK